MTEHQLSLLPFYAGWGIYQQRLVAAIAPLTREQLALRNTPQNWSIGMYATHIVADRAWWFHARMGEGSDDLTSLELWALGVVRRTWIHPHGGRTSCRTGEDLANDQGTHLPA